MFLITVANISDSNVLGVRVHVRRGAYQKKGTMLTSSTSMPWPNISVANMRIARPLVSKTMLGGGHVRRGAMSGGGHVRRGPY